MIKLTHLIYCSSATQTFTDDELVELLEKARSGNEKVDVTGMLLYENGSFFQVIEGPPESIDKLYQKICTDPRHTKVITIINEPIAKRTFADWTMGYSKISAREVGDLVGLNDFFKEGNSLNQLDSTRAKKLLQAFKDGRWRSKLALTAKNEIDTKKNHSSSNKAPESERHLSCAFQPIIDGSTGQAIAYEAFPCQLDGKLLDNHSSIKNNFNSQVLQNEFRQVAILLAKKLRITCNLTFSFRVEDVDNAHAAIRALIAAANQADIPPSGIILKVNQDNLIGEPVIFAQMIQEFRGAGLKLAIDNFGTGRSSLNLLETYHPDYISLNTQLVTGINSNGARQAIVRGVTQTCNDLGIDMIANHINSYAEFEWFICEGITLFQGDLIARPAFEKLPTALLPELEKAK